MSQQETMRLVAEVVDKSSGAIKKIQSSFKHLGDEAAKAHAKGGKAAREHAKHIRELHERAAKLKEFAADALTPALASVGITAFGVGEAIGTMAEKIRRAAEKYEVLNDAIKRGHVSSQFVQGMSIAFQRLGMDASKANGFISQTGEMLDKLRRGNAQEMQRLQGTFGNTLPWLDRVLKGAHSYEEASTRIMKALTDERVPIDQRRKLAEAFNIDPRIASKNGKELGEALMQGMRDAAEHGLDFKLLKRLDDAYTNLSVKQDAFWNDLVNKFGPGAVQIIDKLAGSMGAVEKEIDAEVRDAKALYDVIAKIVGLVGGDNSKDGGGNINRWIYEHTGPKFLHETLPHYLYNDTPAAKSGDKPIFPGGTSLYHKSAFIVGDSRANNALSEGVKEGVLAAFREWAGLSTAPGVSGFQNASFTTDGRYSGGSFRSGGGFNLLPNGSFDSGYGNDGAPVEGSNAHKGVGGGAVKGITPKSMPSPKLSKSVTNMSHAVTGGTGVGYDRVGGEFDRSRFARELEQKPWLHDKILRIAANEQGRNRKGTQAVLESMMNRAVVRGTNLETQARWHGIEHRGYYAPGTMRKGALENAKSRAILESSLNKVLHNSNIANYATDNSSQGLAVREARTGRFRLLAEYGGKPGSHTGQRGVESFFAPGTAEPSFALRWDKLMSTELARKEHGSHGAHLADHIRNHVKQGIKDSMHSARLEGNASLSVDFRNMPRGTQVSSKASGMFKTVRLNRGQQMPMASEDA